MSIASLTPAQMREDLEFLKNKWAPLEKSFSADRRREFDAAVRDVIARADTLSPADFALEVMRLVAIPGNGHTGVANADGLLGPFMPIRAWWFADGLYVVTASPPHADLLGARIEKFGTLSAEEALARVAPFIGGAQQWVRYLGTVGLMSPKVLRHIGAFASPEDATLTLQLRDGRREAVDLAHEPADAPPGRPSARTILVPAGADVWGRWPHVLDHLQSRSPLYGEPGELATLWIGDDGKVLYLRSNELPPGAASAAFSNRLIGVLDHEVVAKRPKHVVVDLRLNTGGNFFGAVLFTQALPRLLPSDGKIFVLVSRVTFSAAIVTAALIKGHAGGRATLIGERMGDDSQFWAEARTKSLPHSKIEVRYSPLLHDWINGCSQHPDCFWGVTAFGVRNDTLEPDLRIDPTFEQYAAGRDPVLEAALALAKQ
jgi:hypothetical protein